MPAIQQFAPILFNENEQVVIAIEGRILPTLNSAIWISMVVPVYLYLSLIIFHRFCRSVVYIVTTERVLVVEPQGIIDEIQLDEIVRIRTSRKSMMIYGQKKRLWLARIPDAIFFESLINNVIAKVASQKVS